MAKYHRGWQLETIPAAEIPDHLLISWWSSYRARCKPKKITDDPKERERLDKQAQRMRERRASGKA